MDLAQPLARTWLSLGRYAQIMGLNPLSFHNAVAKNTAGDYLVGDGSCSDIWYQHDWQDTDKVSRETLSLAIQDAEHDIASIVGYPLAPTWYVEEPHSYPKFHRIEYDSFYGARGSRKSIFTNWRKVIAPGRRATTLIDDAVAVTYSDQDADGFRETAKVTVATSLTDAAEIHVYFPGESGAEEWEIRPCRKKSITAGSFTAEFYTWQMIDPDLLEQFPIGSGANLFEIDLSGAVPGGAVTTVDVYREYNDTTLASAQFIWEAGGSSCTFCGGTGCIACGLTAQDGCFDVRDDSIGEVSPWPAAYDNSIWSPSSFSNCSEPDQVKLWYFAGDYNQRFLKSSYYDSLSDKMARVIARMATARLNKPLCACGNSTALFDYLTRDLSISTQGMSSMLDFTLLGNPFGTKQGELEAWQYVSKTLGVGTFGVAL